MKRSNIQVHVILQIFRISWSASLSSTAVKVSASLEALTFSCRKASQWHVHHSTVAPHKPSHTKSQTQATLYAKIAPLDSTPHITPEHPSGPSGLHLSYMVTSWSLHGPPRHPHDMRQWRFIRAQLANKREHMHRHRILALVGHFLGSRFSIWASGFLILLCFKWWRPVRTTNLLVGPCSALALVFYLIPSDIATIAMSLILSSAFLRLLSFGSDISCQILCNVATDCTLSRNLRRSVPLTYPAASANVHNSRIACSETSVILCKRRTALDEMLLLLKMQNKMIVNLSMESSLLYNEVWSINPLNHIFQVSRKPSCHTASKSLNKSCAPTHPRPPSSTFPLHAQVTAPYPGFADWADQNSTATELDSKFPAAALVHMLPHDVSLASVLPSASTRAVPLATC